MDFYGLSLRPSVVKGIIYAIAGQPVYIFDSAMI